MQRISGVKALHTHQREGRGEEAVSVNNMTWYSFIGDALDVVSDVLARAHQDCGGQKGSKCEPIMELEHPIVDGVSLVCEFLHKGHNTFEGLQHAVAGGDRDDARTFLLKRSGFDT